LVVDDDSAIRESLARALVAELLEVVVARGVKDALEQISRNPPDLVVTDLGMAPLSGWDLIFHLGGRYPATPVIVLSARPPSRGERLDAVAAYFQKPVEISALLQAIRRQIGRPNPRPAADAHR
jgi:DNA-binding response OmpR family regulator